MKKIVSISLLFCIFLTGCWDQKIYEQTGFILNIGIESSPDGNLLVTYTRPVIGIEKKDVVEDVTVEANLIREAREKGRLFSPKLLEGGKIQHIIFSKDIASKGISKLMEIFLRDPVNPALAFVIVTEEKPSELLSKAASIQNKPTAAYYINRLIMENIKNGYIPDSRILYFYTSYLAPGVDPIVPTLKSSQDGMEITGTALFAEDKMVGSINTSDTALLLDMMGEGKNHGYIFKNEDIFPRDATGKGGISLGSMKPKRKVDLSVDNGKVTAKIALSYKVTLEEYYINNFWDEKEHKKLEDVLSQQLTSECNRIIKYTQQVGSDPIGIGEMVRARYYSSFDNSKWQKAYKDSDITVDVRLSIEGTGTMK